MKIQGNVPQALRKHLPPEGASSILLVVPRYTRLAMPRHSVRYLAGTLVDHNLMQRIAQNSKIKGLNDVAPPELHVRILDLSVAPKDFDLAGFLTSFSPSVLGVTVDAHSAGAAFEIAKLAPSHTLKVAGGYFPSAQPSSTLKGGFDIAVIGAGEETLGEIVLAQHFLAYGQFKDVLEEIPGISYKTNSKTTARNENRIPQIHLDDLPFPHNADPLLIFNRFPQLEGLTQASIVGSRGCGNRCLYCSGHSVTLGKVRSRSAANILAEVAALYQSGTRTIVFDEEDFMLLHPRAEMTKLLAGLRTLKEQDPTFGWVIETRGDRLSPESIIAMAAAGLKILAFGVETLDQPLARTLKADPRLSIDNLNEATRTAQAAGIEVYYNLIIGTPGYGWQQAISTAKELLKQPPDKAAVGRYKLYPGSPFYEQSSTADRLAVETRQLRIVNPDKDYPTLPTAAMTAAEIKQLEDELEIFVFGLTIARAFPPVRQQWLVALQGIIEAFRINAIYDLFLNSEEPPLPREKLLQSLPKDLQTFSGKRQQGSKGFRCEEALGNMETRKKVLNYLPALISLQLPEESTKLIDSLLENTTVQGGRQLASLPLNQMKDFLTGVLIMLQLSQKRHGQIFTRVIINDPENIYAIAKRKPTLDNNRLALQAERFLKGESNKIEIFGYNLEINNEAQTLTISPAS